VQVDPIKSTLKAPGTKHLSLKYDGPLSKFTFKFHLRHHSLDTFSYGVTSTTDDGRVTKIRRSGGRGLHSSTSQLNLSCF
jgi:hypothetical protein